MGCQMNKAVFLDRDGTINKDKGYLYRIEDFEFIPGSIEGLKIFQDAGYKLILITNQSGIARGYYTEKDYKVLTEWLLRQFYDVGIEIARCYYCPHHPEAKILKYRFECECRKPAISLFQKAVNDFNLDLDNCIAIGDRVRDCCICKYSKCKGYIVGNTEDKKTISAIKKYKIENVTYQATLYDCAVDVKNELLNTREKRQNI